MLRPRKRINRREIKEDTLVTVYVRVQRFIQNHSKQINIGIFVIAAIAIIGIFMIRSKKKAELTAAGELGIAEQFYYVSNYPRAIDELTKIADTYSGTNAAGSAIFFVANSYFATGDYDNAEKYYKIYLKNYSKNKLFSASSSAGVAACLDSKERYSDAARLYENDGKKYGDLFVAPFYLRDAGRCYTLAGNKEKAKEIYKYILEKYSGFNMRQQISFLLNSL